MPIWVALPPLALVLYLGWRSFAKRRGTGWKNGAGWLHVPGLSRSVSKARWASFAEMLATLDKGGVPLEEGLPLAACASGDPAITESGSALAAELQHNEPVKSNRSAARRMPPFLRWAILNAQSTIGRARAIEMAALVYRDSADRSAERAQILAPMIVTALLGGGITLLYALALFMPVVEMLKALAR
jgi:type II secretory pathway component PulF